MTDILRQIADYKLEEIAAAKIRAPLPLLRRQAETAGPVRPFGQALRNTMAAGKFALIGEIKKASPSRGVIRADFDPPALARAYEQGGAACLSVLTDKPSFQGAPEYLQAVRQASKLPALRKDFILDLYQIYESRALGADCVLLIMLALPEDMSREFTLAAQSLGMDVILEVHNETELEQALKLPSKLIGINNRDLKTFDTSTARTARLAPLIPKDRTVISESGLGIHGDLVRVSQCGVRAFLVGETLMRQKNLEAATRHILHGMPKREPANI